MSKEKKLGVTSYIKNPTKDNSSIFSRITYERKKIEIKSPTFLCLNDNCLSLPIEKVTLNDERILNFAKQHLEGKNVDFKLSIFKDPDVQKLFDPIEEINEKFTALLMAEKLRDDHPNTSFFIDTLLELDAEYINDFLTALEELNYEIYESVGEEIVRINDELIDLLRTYLRLKKYLYLSVADLIQDSQLTNFIATRATSTAKHHFDNLKDAWNPGLFPKNLTVVI